MTTKTKLALRALLAASSLSTGTIVAIAPASAQTTVASIRGRVIDAAAAPVAGANVVAANLGTNQAQRAVTGADGGYVLDGLRPGTYTITITGADGATFSRRVTVAVGQSATLDAQLGAATPTSANPTAATPTAAPAPEEANDIVVTGTRLIETKTSEVATNISQQQIRDLPQSDRNFLTFAALAPGVKFTDDGDRTKSIRAGASPAGQVNVFVDGVSYKNQVLDGGIAGQTDSRGNPFAQIAIGEFRVLTQNYKAEYEQAGSAIISAITKSGTNEFHGEAFGQYTDGSLSSTDAITKRAGFAKPPFKRKQYGAAFGGPIVKDRLFFFAAYEGNDQDRSRNVILGNRSAENVARFGQYEGAFPSPFRGDFYFGKLTFTPDDNQTFDASVALRNETDISEFGADSLYTYQGALNRRNKVNVYNLKWTYNGDSFVNEFNTSYLHYDYNPTSLDLNSPTFEYQGVIKLGGKESTQRIVQDSFVIRNDLTYTGLNGHVFKGGIRFSFQDYDFNKQFFVQPYYLYVNDSKNNLDFSFPSRAQLGLGNPRIVASNSQLGIYLQDDWDITNKLQLNVGLRWDYESNLFNNHYRTPENARQVLLQLPRTDYFHAEDYITDGTDRPPLMDLFQPRIGFSYDVYDDQRTVFFGGYGKYYDRNVFNNTLDERFRLQYQYGYVYFSRDGLPRDGNVTVKWDPKYLTRDGLLPLATGPSGFPELFAVKNNARPPSTDQFSLGIRQKVGAFQLSATGAYIRGQHGYTHLFADRYPNNGNQRDTTVAGRYGYSNTLIGYDGLKTRYKAMYFTATKPYTDASGWGIDLTYTLARGRQNGNDLFSLDALTPDGYGFRPNVGDERHRIVFSGTVRLPWDVKFSTLSTLGSGAAYNVIDQTNGSLPGQTRIYSLYPKKNCIHHVFAYCEVNLTLQKDFKLFWGQEVGVGVDLLNAFNNKNYSSFDGYTNGRDDPLEFEPKSTLTLPRRVQFRLNYKF